jgi:DNA topoisomerase VI subunit B
MDKKHQTLFSYRSQKTSIERINDTENRINTKKLCLYEDETKNENIIEEEIKEPHNLIHGYKIKIPFKEKKNLRSNLNLQSFNNTSCNLVNGQKILSSRKFWKKK